MGQRVNSHFEILKQLEEKVSDFVGNGLPENPFNNNNPQKLLSLHFGHQKMTS